MDAVVVAVAPGGRITSRAPLTGGVSARVEAVDVTGPDGTVHRLVCRWPPSDAAAVAAEAQLIRAVGAAGLPVPRVRAVVPGPGLVMDRVEGTADVPHAGVTAIADLLRALHALDPGALELPPLETRLDPVTESTSWLEALGRDPTPLRRAAGAGRRNGQRLLHGDVWPGNLLWRDAGIAALLDWEDAAVGDPLSDLACTRVELRCALGPEATAALTARYLDGAPVDATDLPAWDAYVSAAALTWMGGWGLSPDALAHRHRETGAFLDAALSQLAAP